MLGAVEHASLATACVCTSHRSQGAGPGSPAWQTARVAQASRKIGDAELSSNAKDGEAGTSGWMHKPVRNGIPGREAFLQPTGPTL